jgi:hypothetical protein
MLLGPDAASPPVGLEPSTGLTFVQPQDTVRHLGILLTTGQCLSACDQEEATRQMFAKRPVSRADCHQVAHLLQQLE